MGKSLTNRRAVFSPSFRTTLCHSLVKIRAKLPNTLDKIMGIELLCTSERRARPGLQNGRSDARLCCQPKGFTILPTSPNTRFGVRFDVRSRARRGPYQGGL